MRIHQLLVYHTLHKLSSTRPLRCSLQLSEFLARKWDEASGGVVCGAITTELELWQVNAFEGAQEMGAVWHGLGDLDRFSNFQRVFLGIWTDFQRVCTVVLQKIGLSTPSERRVNSRRSQSLSNFPCSNWSEGSHVGRARLRCGQHRFYGFYIILWMGNCNHPQIIKSNQNEVDSQEGFYWLLIDSYAFLKAIVLFNDRGLQTDGSVVELSASIARGLMYKRLKLLSQAGRIQHLKWYMWTSGLLLREVCMFFVCKRLEHFRRINLKYQSILFHRTCDWT